MYKIDFIYVILWAFSGQENIHRWNWHCLEFQAAKKFQFHKRIPGHQMGTIKDLQFFWKWNMLSMSSSSSSSSFSYLSRASFFSSKFPLFRIKIILSVTPKAFPFLAVHCNPQFFILECVCVCVQREKQRGPQLPASDIVQKPFAGPLHGKKLLYSLKVQWEREEKKRERSTTPCL